MQGYGQKHIMKCQGEKNGFLSPGNIKNSQTPIIKDERTIDIYVFYELLLILPYLCVLIFM